MPISSNELKGIARGQKGKGKTSPPSIKVPQIPKAAKEKLVPYQSPQRRSGLAGV